MGVEAEAARAAPSRSGARLAFDSVDIEVDLDGEPASDSRQRIPTLIRPLEDRDPLDVVMESLRGVRCQRAVEVASVCLAATVRAVGCRAAIAHLWDPRERTFVIVYALGPNAGVLLNARHPADDELLASTPEGGASAPRVVNYDGRRAAMARHAAVGGAWSVLVAPIARSGEVLGAMELIDPLDGSWFDERSVAAARYAAEKQADLLHGAVSGIGRILLPTVD